MGAAQFNWIGLLIAVGWLLSGFYAVEFAEIKASREHIPAKLFPYITLLALFFGPPVLLVLYVNQLVSESGAKLFQQMWERRNRINITIMDSRGQEMYGSGSNGDQAMNAAIHELKKILYAGLEQHASDIFIDPKGVGAMTVRMRVDGTLRTSGELQQPLGDNLTNVIKVVSGMDITEKRRPQDGAFSIDSDIGSASLRVASVGAFGGEKITLRMLGSAAGPLTLEDAGLQGGYLRCMQDAVRIPSGMVLVCGPTGSGKTTTLYALLNAIDYRMKNVISIEDPIEHVLPNVSQMEVNERANITFSKLLRNSLRQNPDIICVGEIRDEETAEVAVHAAQTGHLIIATVHSNDNVGTIDRLVNLGVPLRSVAGVLQMIVSQRLVRKLCDCAVPDEPSPELAEYLRNAQLPVDGLRKPCGCEKCGGTGYVGRVAIFDIMVMNNRLREIFENEQTTMAAVKLEIEKEHGSSIMAYEGYKLAAAGITSVAEVERVTFDMEHSF